MDTSSTGSPANLMGQLRCLIEKHGRRKFSGYKKRFWVVNYNTKRLEVYKNDQSHEPANVYRAEDIRGVIYTGDKQNKFYAMIVQTRLQQNIKFRMNSLEERERWSRAITQLIDAFSMSHRRNNIFEFLQRRTRTVGRSLNVIITVDWPRLLTAPQEMLEYTVEALDSALANVTALVRSYGTDFTVPRHYTLNMQTLDAPPEDGYEFPGPQYDPVKKSAVLNVMLYKDALGHVKFSVTEPEEVVSIMQSNVFRNPLIEGWIGTSPGCAEACEGIRAALNITDRSFPITFQWGQHLSDSDRVERYLQEFVNEGFFRGLLATVKETLRDVERLLEDLLMANSTSTATSPTSTPRNLGGASGGLQQPQQSVMLAGGGSVGGGGGATFMPQGPLRKPSGVGVHGRSFSATLFLDGPGPTAGGGSGGGPSSAGGAGGGLRDRDRDRDPSSSFADPGMSFYAGLSGGAAASAVSDVHATAVRLLSDNISGLAIQLDKRVVEEGKRPPLTVVERNPEYDLRCRPAFLLVAKYRQHYAQPASVPSNLHEQLFECAFHALLSKQISSLRNRLNGVFNGKVKVAIMWDRLLQVFRMLDATLFQRDLPKLVSALADVYLPRMLHTVQSLASTRANPEAFAKKPTGTAAAATGSGTGTTWATPYKEVLSPSGAFGGASPPSAPIGGGGGVGGTGSTNTTTAATTTVNSDAGVNCALLSTVNIGERVTLSDPLTEEGELTVFDVFTHCVGGVVIDFFSFPELIESHGGNPQQPSVAAAAAALPEPSVHNGSLTDAIICADSSTAGAMVSAVNQLRGATSRRAPMLVRNICTYAATPRMGAWCEKYFASAENVAACRSAPRRVVEDEFASDSDVGTPELGLDLDNGEAVAQERREEFSVLNMKRVVNTIYDSQGDSIDLKIGAQEIVVAIHSLQHAFKGKKVTKHDIMRVLTINLRRLRSMYSRATDGEANLFLSEDTVRRLLKDFCEYSETEQYVVEALQKHSGQSYRARAGSNPFNNTSHNNDNSNINGSIVGAGIFNNSVSMSQTMLTQRLSTTIGSFPSGPSDTQIPVERRLTLQPTELPLPLNSFLANRRGGGLTTNEPVTPAVDSADTPLRVEDSATHATPPMASANSRNRNRDGTNSDKRGVRVVAAGAAGGGGGGGSGTARNCSKNTLRNTNLKNPNNNSHNLSDIGVSDSSSTVLNANTSPPVHSLHNTSALDTSNINSNHTSGDTASPSSPTAAKDSRRNAKGKDDADSGNNQSTTNGSSRPYSSRQRPENITTATGAATGGKHSKNDSRNSRPDAYSVVDDEDAESLYDFQVFSSVALNELLPMEAVIARRAWRTGFVFGLENAGKSHIVNCLRCLPRPTVATVGLARQVVAFDEWVFSLNELGGRDSFRKNWTFYAKRMEEVHFLLHVVDCSSLSTYEESIKYLKEVAQHFRSTPLMIVFNNYQATPCPKPLKDVAYEYEVDKIEKINPQRSIFLCTQELSVAHPSPRSTLIPTDLYATLRELCDVLRDSTPEAHRPTVPKDVTEGRSAMVSRTHAHQHSQQHTHESARTPYMPGRVDSWRGESSLLETGTPMATRIDFGNSPSGKTIRSVGGGQHDDLHYPY